MDILKKITEGIINPLIGILFGIAVAYFLWGVVEFIWNANNEDKRTTGKQHIIWGLVGLLIMSTVAGIIAIIKNFVGA